MQSYIVTVKQLNGIFREKDGVREYADSIVLASFCENAWKCVVDIKTNPGDKMVFFEIDTQLPQSDKWAFLEKLGWRVKTAKFMGTISQGLAIPAKELGLEHLAPGTSCDEYTGAQHWHMPEPMDQSASGNFPIWVVPKTDEVNILSNPALFSLFGPTVTATIKEDGTSLTTFFDNGELKVCSRNLQLKPGDNKYWQAVEPYRETIEKFPNLVFQGEVVGPGIQKNRSGYKDIHVRFFDIYDREHKEYFLPEDFFAFCQFHGLKTVDRIMLPNIVNINALQDFANSTTGEGIVVRSSTKVYEYLNYERVRLSLKVLNQNYLLKNGV